MPLAKRAECFSKPRHDLLEMLEERYGGADPLITPIGSNFPAKACGGPTVNRTKRLDQASLPVTEKPSASKAPDPGARRLRRNSQPARNLPHLDKYQPSIVCISAAILIVSSLDLNLRLQMGRGFSRFCS
jgi:hypothetical protein